MATLQRGVMRHPKIAAISDAAFRLWVAGNDYCDELLTDGIILKSALVGHGVAAKCTPKLLAELTRVISPYQAGLWEDRGDYYVVHDYLHWNDSREVIQKNRARARERAARFRDRRHGDQSGADTADTHGVDNGDNHGARNGVTNGVSHDGIRDRNRDRDRDRSTDLPPTPLGEGGSSGSVSSKPPTRAERKRAEEFRRKVWGGCRHEPRCASFDACLVTLVQGFRLAAADEPPFDDEVSAEAAS